MISRRIGIVANRAQDDVLPSQIGQTCARFNRSVLGPGGFSVAQRRDGAAKGYRIFVRAYFEFLRLRLHRIAGSS